MKRKILCYLLLLGLLLSAVACGSKSNTGSSENGTENTAAEITQPAATESIAEDGYSLPIVSEPLTLIFLTRESEDTGTSFNDNKALVWQEYEKKTGIKIQFDAVPSSNLEETVQLRLAARQNVPDMIQIPGQQDGSYLTKYLQDGVIIALNDYIDKYAINMKKVFEQYPVYKQELTLPDGSIAGIGDLRASKYQFRSQMIRMDWLEKLNLKMPATPDELLKVAKAFVTNDMNENGKADEIGMAGYGDQWKELGHAWGLHFVTGSGMTVKDGKVIYESITSQYQDFLRYLKKCVDEKVFPADWISVDKKTNLARIANSQVGIQVRTPAEYALTYQDPNDSMKKNDPEADWRIIPAMDGPYGKGIFVKEAVAEIWRTVVVTSVNKHIAETVKWLDYVIFSEEGQRYNMYGIEDLTYKMENGNVVKISSELDNNKPLKDGTWLGYQYMPGIYTTEGDEISYAALNLSDDNPALLSLKACWPYLEEPFVAPIPSLEDGKRISELNADIITYRDEMFYKFLTGKADIDKDFANYIKQLNSIGLNEVMDIYQKSYDNRSNASK
jgi:putative aldouronate transport system substrate-binding protein